MSNKNLSEGLPNLSKEYIAELDEAIAFGKNVRKIYANKQVKYSDEKLTEIANPSNPLDKLVYILIFFDDEPDVVGVFDSEKKAKEKLIEEAVNRCSVYGTEHDIKKLKRQVTREMKTQKEFVYCIETGTFWRIVTKTVQ